jgi:enoyl-[acyl-carrier protein] reductase I
MLRINLKGKKAFIAGVGDDHGFGWAIAKALAEAGAEIHIGTWAPVLKIFKTSLEMGKFDQSRKLQDGSLLEFKAIYPMDAAFDTMNDVPDEIKSNKRYQELNHYAIEDVVKKVQEEAGSIDILVHSLANAPEITKNLLDTSRKGYLAAISASSYSFVSLVSHFGPIMNKEGAVLSLTYLASERVIPGYGGGMSSAKAALESDTRTLAWEAGRRWNIRINTLSAGPYASRAAKAIGMIENMISYSEQNAPLQKQLVPEDVAYAAAFLLSPLASAITGSVVYVDNGLHTMGLASDSPSLKKEC